jgi:hypothetical protein
VSAVITGLGMVSALGGVTSAAAAMRAGITRPRPLAFQQVLDEGAVPEALTGHPVRHVTDGYYFLGRWCRLAHAALRDLERYSPGVELTDAATWRDTGLLVVVGDALDERYTVRDAVDDEYLQSRYVSRLTKLLESVQLERSASDKPGAGELGRALATAVDRALRASSRPLPFDGDIFCDLNGTEACAFDFGLMLSALGHERIAADVQWHSPCAFLGDAGAATGVVSLCMAVRSLVRGYARGFRVLTTNRDQGGVVGAALLGAARA